MKIGYARVSTGEQNINLQLDALRAAGAEKIYQDKGISGGAVIKPVYGEALRHARLGDEIIVWRLDRLSRSLITLITELQLLASQQLAFRSLTENIETVTPAGQLFFHILGAFAQFERDLIRDHTRAGLESARRAGKRLGRPPVIGDAQWQQALTLLEGPNPKRVADVAALLGVTRQAIYKRLSAAEQAQDADPMQDNS